MSGQERSRTREPEPCAVELFLEGGNVLSVYTGEILEANVAIGGGRILYVGPRNDLPGQGTVRLNMARKVLVPGYVEPHCHPAVLYNPLSLGEEVCRLGTTTLVCDDLVFFMLMGVDRFESFMRAIGEMPIKFYWFVCLVPPTPLEGEESLFSSANLERLLQDPHVASIGEITRWLEIVRGNPKILDLIRFAHSLGKRVDGHTAGAKYENLTHICRAGVDSCHESINAHEALERLRLGLHVMLRQSSLRQDLRVLLNGLRHLPHAARRLMLTTDGSTPAFQYGSGMCDHLISIAIEEGIDPVEAYRMATLNPATYFGMEDRIGGIAPGRDADLNVLSGMDHPTPEMVISRGRIVAANQSLLAPFPKVTWEEYFSHGFTSGWEAEADFFRIPAGAGAEGGKISFPVIRLLNTVITRIETVEFSVRKGTVNVSSKAGFSWVATLHRHGTWVSNGILQGFGDRVDGIASSFTTSTEIVAIGRSPDAMALAVNRVLELGGGIVAVDAGNIVFELCLPIGGMMSERPLQELAEKDSELQSFLSSRGFPFHDPLYTFIFLPNDFLPEVRINRRGILNIKTGEVLRPPRSLR